MSLVTRLQDLAVRIGTEAKALRTLINGNATDLSSLTTTAKGNLVAAINEVRASIPASPATINDSTTNSSSVWSSSKTNTEIGNAVAGLVATAPAALDTLNELAAALGNDASFATTTANALGKRVRVDASQSFTAPEKVQGLANLGAIAAADIGNPETNLVTVFEGALT